MRSYQPTNDLPTFKNHQRRNSLNAKTLRSFLILINIHLGKAQFALVCFAQALICWSYCATGTTPGSPEINNYRFVGFEDFLLKILISHMEQISMRSHTIVHSLSKSDRCICPSKQSSTNA